MTGTEKELTDLELDRLLATASKPRIPLDFEQRMMQRIHAASGSNVVQFPVRRMAAPRRVLAPWPLAAALAASLVVGFWLGTGDPVNNLIDSNLGTTAMNDTAQDFGPAGLDDLTSLNVDSAS